MNTFFTDISIDKLIVNPENYRFDSVDNETSAIKIMLQNHNKAIKELLKDILENGLNPLERLLVFKKNEFYIVLEGNRRVTALKIIHNVNLLKDIEQKYFNEYSKILNNANSKINIDKISCAITDNISDSNKWIALKHTGSNGGKGTIPWDTTQKRRFLNKTNPNNSSNIITSLFSYIKSSNIYDDTITQNLTNIPITTLERILSDPYVRENIGIDIKKNTIYKLYPDSEIKKPLSKILHDLINKTIVVTDVYTKNDRLDYIETFNSNSLPNYANKLNKPVEILSNLNLINLPLQTTIDNNSNNDNSANTDNINSNNINNSATTNNTSNNTTNNTSNTNNIANIDNNNSSNINNSTNNNTGNSSSIKATSQKRDNKDINKRKALIPSTFHVKITVPRIQQIYKELKKLDVSDFPNSTSVLFRVFLELVVDEYIEKLNLTGLSNNDKLNKKVQACIDDLKSKNLIDKNKVKPINVAISNHDSLFSINTFNSYVHNKYMLPDATNLKNTWNQFEYFILVLLNSITK